MSGIETRKVQRVGGSTFSLSLPKSWATERGVKAGDSVEFEPLADGTMRLRLVSPSPDATAPLVRAIDAHGMTPEQIGRRVMALYVEGCDRIDVVCKPSIGRAARAFLAGIPQRHAGLEIVDETEERISFQGLVDTDAFDIERGFRRTYALASALTREVLAALAEGDASRLKGVPNSAADVERTALLSLRHQRRVATGRSATALSTLDAVAFGSATVAARQIGRCGASLAASVAEIVDSPVDPRVRSGLVEIGSSALYVCDAAARAVTKASDASADEAYVRAGALEARIHEFRAFTATGILRSNGCSPCLRILPVVEWVHATALAGVDLADIAVQRATRLG